MVKPVLFSLAAFGLVTATGNIVAEDGRPSSQPSGPKIIMVQPDSQTEVLWPFENPSNCSKVINVEPPTLGPPDASLSDAEGSRFFFEPRTEEELIAHGSTRAERDYAAGRGAIELYGLRMGGCDVEEKTGIFIDCKGCTVLNGQDIESEAYNSRLQELIREKGPLPYSEGVKRRIARARSFRNNRPDLAWHDVAFETGKESKPLKIGEYLVQANPFRQSAQVMGLRPDIIEAPEHWQLCILKGAQQLIKLSLLQQDVRVAVWTQAELMVIELEGPEYRFVDGVNGKVISRWNPRLEGIIRELKHADKQVRPKAAS